MISPCICSKYIVEGGHLLELSSLKFRPNISHWKPQQVFWLAETFEGQKYVEYGGVKSDYNPELHIYFLSKCGIIYIMYFKGANH